MYDTEMSPSNPVSERANLHSRENCDVLIP